MGLQPENEYFVRINKLGKLGQDCTGTGDEFNPLIEIYKGEANPQQDFSRGRIETFETSENGIAVFEQKKLLQNLSGSDALIGKSLTLYDADEYTASPDMAQPLACCIIGQNIDPKLNQEQLEEWQQRGPQQNYSVVAQGHNYSVFDPT